MSISNFPDKKTKIVCTVGPASSDKKTILEMIRAGMDVARMNFSHGTHEGHKNMFELLRECEQESGRFLGILCDLQGPKIRTTKLKDGPMELKIGQKIYINQDPNHVGTIEELGCTYIHLIEDLREGDKVLIDDGKLCLIVKSKEKHRALLEVEIGGILKDNKGINLPGTPISAPALTEKDLEDLKFALSLGVDYVALSFVRKADDILLAKQYMKETFAGIIAKIERPEAYDNIDEILNVTDGIMIARGDMGVEFATERVPVMQKELILKAIHAGKPVITATQMLESMIDNPRPTRAEASDVANAVFDGTDAVMLSAESASGRYPIESVNVMSKIIMEVEKSGVFLKAETRLPESEEESERTALGVASDYIARAIKAKAIINFTRSGFSTLLASEYRPEMPIYSFTPYLLTARKMNLYWGVTPFIMPVMDKFPDMMAFMSRELKKVNLLKEGDTVVLLSGAPGSVAQTVDFIQIYKIK